MTTHLAKAMKDRSLRLLLFSGAVSLLACCPATASDAIWDELPSPRTKSLKLAKRKCEQLDRKAILAVLHHSQYPADRRHALGFISGDTKQIIRRNYVCLFADEDDSELTQQLDKRTLELFLTGHTVYLAISPEGKRLVDGLFSMSSGIEAVRKIQNRVKEIENPPVAHGRTVSFSDSHYGFAGFKKRDNTYSIDVKVVGKGAKLKAWIVSEIDSPTSGMITMVSPGGGQSLVGEWKEAPRGKKGKDGKVIRPEGLSPIEFDVSKQVTKPGTYKVTFSYAGGQGSALIIFQTDIEIIR